MSSNGIVFFTGGSPQAMALAHELNRQFDLRAIVIQEKKKAVNHNPVIGLLQKLLGNALLEKLLIYRKKGEERNTLLTEMRLKDKAQKALHDQLKKYNTNSWPDVPAIYTPDLNSSDTEAAVRALDPALIVVWGTGIIRQNIIDIPSIGVVNAHTSILPHYRGSFVEFWQSYNGEYDKAGVTFHFINDKIDEGDIVSAHVYSGHRPADPFMIRSANVLTIVQNYPIVIQSILDSTYARIKQSKDETRAYLFKHITLEKKRELFRKLGH